VEKFYCRGSSLNFSFLHHAHGVNYEADICVNGYGMDRIIIMGDSLLVMAGGAIFSGTGRKDIGRMKVRLSLCFIEHLVMKHGGNDTFSCTQSWMQMEVKAYFNVPAVSSAPPCQVPKLKQM